MLPARISRPFEQLKWLIDREGKNLAGPDGLGLLANVGLIAKEPFSPSPQKRAILNTAADVGYK